MTLGLTWTRQTILRRKGASIIMVGRPRKAGRRKPCGRLAQTYQNPRAQVAAQPHRMLVPERFREQPEAGSAFGRLLIYSKITIAQHDAGQRYAELAHAHRRAVMAAAADPRAMDYQRSIGGMGEGIPDDAAKAIIREFNAAFDAIANVRWQFAVMHHAVHGRPIADQDALDWLVCGLNRLVAHFGIDSRSKIVSRA